MHRAPAEGGHLAVLQWARANGCPWNYETCFSAAHDGQLEALQWAIENGCPIYLQGCMSIATQNEHPDVVAWLNENQALSH